jgi:hypothetical protein
MNNQTLIAKITWVIVLLFVLMIPCIYNAFPLVTSDSGTYIASGIQGWVPIDRPLFYGLFVGFLSFKHSLWYPIIFQNLILAILLFKMYQHFLSSVKNGMVYLFITLIICALTGAAWVSVQIMPDIFVAIGFFSFVLLLLKPVEKIEKWTLALFYLMSLAMHNSHMLIFNLLSIFGLIIIKFNIFSFKVFIPIKKLYFVLLLSIFSWLINPTINLIYEGKFRHSGSPYAYLMAKYAENGLLATYVKEKCVTKKSIANQPEPGVYFLRNLKSNLFLDVEGYSMEAGAKIHQWEYTGADNQKFILEKAGNYQKISSVKSGKYVSSYNNDAGKLALKQDNSSNNNNQLFELIFENSSPIVSIKLKDRNAYLSSDTCARAFGMQFIEGNNNKDEYCRFELVSAANCFCYFKDSIPNNAMVFLWDSKSILSRTGNWLNHEKEYKTVMHDMLFTPAYFGRNLNAALGATVEQLGRNNVGDGIVKYDSNSSPYFAIQNTMPKSITKFLESRENKGELQFVLLNYVNEYLMKISFYLVIILLAMPYFRKKIKTEMLALICFTLLILIINAFVTGAMANILSRLQSRISWVLPLIVLMLVYNLMEELNSEKVIKE